MLYVDLVCCSFAEFIHQLKFLVDSLGFSIYKIMSPLNRDSFTSFFPIWVPFISFSCPVALAKASSTMSTSSGESGHPGVVPGLRGKSNLSPSV